MLNMSIFKDRKNRHAPAAHIFANEDYPHLEQIIYSTFAKPSLDPTG
jgi:hypothetical protein